MPVCDGSACADCPHLRAGRLRHIRDPREKCEHQSRYDSAAPFGFAKGKAGRDAERSWLWLAFKPFARSYQSKGGLSSCGRSWTVCHASRTSESRLPGRPLHSVSSQSYFCVRSGVARTRSYQDHSGRSPANGKGLARPRIATGQVTNSRSMLICNHWYYIINEKRTRKLPNENSNSLSGQPESRDHPQP